MLRKMAPFSLIVLVFIYSGFGQSTTPVSGANAAWKLYRLVLKDVTVSFPKLPIFYSENDLCRSVERSTYSAYADEVVYTAVVSSATREKPPSWCDKKSSFGRETLRARIDELIIAKKLVREPKSPEGKQTLLTGERDHVAIVDDIENGRFVELWITHNKGLRVNKEKFWDSIRLTHQVEGVDVNEGAPAIIGDTAQKTNADEFWEGLKVSELNFGYRTVHYPRAVYTESARKAEVQGTVRLRITLLWNGSVGTIIPVTQLPHGMTEQAIRAARLTVFLPKKNNGVNVSVIVTRDYTFTIY